MATQSTIQFRVSSDCISCDNCSNAAPMNFALSAELDRAYVTQQPRHHHEFLACEEAKISCPVEAIISEAVS